jgi:hypothetical protein
MNFHRLITIEMCHLMQAFEHSNSFFIVASFDNGLRGCHSYLVRMPPAHTFADTYHRIDRPLCTRCISAMWLTQVAPVTSHRERRTFECPVCRAFKLVVTDFETKKLRRNKMPAKSKGKPN